MAKVIERFFPEDEGQRKVAVYKMEEARGREVLIEVARDLAKKDYTVIVEEMRAMYDPKVVTAYLRYQLHYKGEDWLSRGVRMQAHSRYLRPGVIVSYSFGDGYGRLEAENGVDLRGLSVEERVLVAMHHAQTTHDPAHKLPGEGILKFVYRRMMTKTLFNGYTP